MALTHLSLGSPIQLDDGSTFEDYKTLYSMPSPFPSTFSEANSSPSTQTSSVPSSSFLGYTPPTSDEESDKDADGEFYSYSSVASPSEEFPSIVSPIPLPPSNAVISWTGDTPYKHGHSLRGAWDNKDNAAYKTADELYVPSQMSFDSINATLVAGTFLETTQSCLSAPGGLIAPLYPSDINLLESVNDTPRRDSQSSNLSFGSYGTTSDGSDVATSALAPLSTSFSSQSMTPVPSIGAPQVYTPSDSTLQGKQTYLVDEPAASLQGYFPRSGQYFACSFADCSWSTDNSSLLSAHNEEHVRNAIFNCPITSCLKHFTTITNLEAHRLLEHAFTDLPLAPHTSFVPAVQSEADQYFPPMPAYDGNTHLESASSAQGFQPYYQVAQSVTSDTIGLGFVQNGPDQFLQAQAAGPTQNAPINSAFVSSFVPPRKALPRRASDSIIQTGHNGHVSSNPWENTLPSLQEEEVLCTATDQLARLQPSTPDSASPSTVNTPQQDGSQKRRVAFSLELPPSTKIPRMFNASSASVCGGNGVADCQTTAHHPGRANSNDLAAMFHTAHTTYTEGVFGPHTNLQAQMMEAGLYHSNSYHHPARMHYSTDGSNGLQGYESFGQHYAAPDYTTQHVNLASIDPTMAISPTYADGEYYAPAYRPSLANHMAHQRVVRATLPRRGSESSYFATHGPAHMSAHPYALALQAALASNSKQIVLPDLIGPARSKPVTGRTTLPGPKGQEIPKAYRRGSTAGNLVQEGYVAEEVESFNLAEMKLHPCDFEGCCRVFKRLEHKRRHQRSHTQEKPYQCPIEGCKRFFSRSDNLTQHKRTHERNGRTSRLTLANLQQCGLSEKPEGNSPEQNSGMQAH